MRCNYRQCEAYNPFSRRNCQDKLIKHPADCALYISAGKARTTCAGCGKDCHVFNDEESICRECRALVMAAPDPWALVKG